MKHAILLIKLGIIVLVVAMVLRAYGYNYYNPIPPVGVTPGALHRLVDTAFLCAIAMALVEIYRVLKSGPSSGPACREKENNKEEIEE